MWCARLPLSRPDSAVVVRVGRNWAAFGSPFFYLRRIAKWRSFSNSEMFQHFTKRNASLTLASQ